MDCRTISQTKSRTIADPWLTPLMPENALLINPLDATRLSLVEWQEVKVTSATNRSGGFDIGPGKTKIMRGKVHLTQTLRPGVVSFALGFGHWATGAVAIDVDGLSSKAKLAARKASTPTPPCGWIPH